MKRREFLGTIPVGMLLAHQSPFALAQSRRKGVLLMNRIGPSTSELYVANADGSGERKFLNDSVFEYHAAWSPDGQWVLFTSERNGRGQADIFRARPDGTDIQPLVTNAAVDDAAAMSPDGSSVAFVSTREGYLANIWVQDLKSGRARNLTGKHALQRKGDGPTGFFRPSWSPDGKWLAFSSDRDTEWRGHDNGTGWEHTQELSVYVIQADGSGFRRIASKPGYCLGSPRWSPDGKRVIFYELTTEDTWGARRPERIAKVVSQIVSVDVATGERIEHTTGPGLKVFPQFLGATEIAYHRKGGPGEGIVYASGRPGFQANVRSPAWSPDGKTVIYEKTRFREWKQNQPLYSWNPDWEYRYTDVFPSLARDGTLVITEKDLDSSIAIMNPDGSSRKRIFEASKAGLPPQFDRTGLSGAFQPAWSPDNQWLAFGVGVWFALRSKFSATLMRVRRDGAGLEALTDGTVHSGFPSYSADGKQLVYRVWGEKDIGLRVMNLEDRSTRALTNHYDNLPGWSPDGSRILFTRKMDDVNFDVCTLRPDGSDLRVLTNTRTNDGHAVWAVDGRILYNSTIYGFREEVSLYDQTFQPDGQIFIMNADGSGKRILTDSLWEDAMPCYVPAG